MPRTFALAEIFSRLDGIPSFATVTFTVAVVLVSVIVIYFLKNNNGKVIRNDSSNSSVDSHNKQTKKLKDVISKEWTITKVQHEYIHKNKKNDFVSRHFFGDFSKIHRKTKHNSKNVENYMRRLETRSEKDTEK